MTYLEADQILGGIEYPDSLKSHLKTKRQEFENFVKY